MSASTGATPQRVPLHDVHAELGARFVDFAGWEMPVQYRGILAEHECVRQRVGLFDVSHMGEIEITGPGALDLCQSITTNDARLLEVGRAQYTLWCTQSGGTIDDTILYRLGAERYLFCVNASNAEPCWNWISKQAEGRRDVELRNRSAELGLIAVQGPRAQALLARLAAPGVADLPRFACQETRVADCAVMVARTGYTGEDGFEVFTPLADLERLWRQLLEKGADLGVQPIGLGARDTLRLEAALPLYGHELGPEISPLQAGLGWAVKLEKGEFVGRDALRAERAAGPARRLIGLRVSGNGIARGDYPVLAGGRQVGVVTSGTKSPTLGEPIALALVAKESLDAALEVEIRGRGVAVERVKLPFYRRT